MKKLKRDIMIKIQYIFGERKSGRTSDIINNINSREEFGIYVPDFAHKKLMSSKIQDKIGLSLLKQHNIRYFTKPTDLHGVHADKIFIDNADYIKNIGDFKPYLMDSMGACGGTITYYFNKPGDHFSIRML